MMEKSATYRYIGIDPGKSGGITMIDTKDNYMEAVKCPDRTIDMALIFHSFVGDEPNRVRLLMEKVWARPNNAVRSAFTYGVNYGQWLGIAAATEIHMYTVLPSEWMSSMGCKKGMDYAVRKKWLKEKSQSLYPNSKITLYTADSILIAHYAKETYFNEKSSSSA
tara:strand:+ start:7045 stop:7539 length:495 start_codon:yes stop_codon:yes gene_type:complete